MDNFNLQVKSKDTLSLKVKGEVGIPTNDYYMLTNKPRIENNELVGNKTFEDLGLVPLTNREIEDLLN